TVMSWRGMSGASQVSWSPDGSRIAYLASTPGKDAGKTLFVYELDSGSVRALLEGVKELQSYRWSPTGTGIVFTTQVKAEKDKRGVKLLEGLMDRQATYRNKSYLHWVDVTSGVQRRLTAGDETTSLQDISADGKRLLFSRLFDDLEEIPFSRNELWELELSSGKATKLREIGWLNGVSYAPVGDKLLIGARADEFEGRGVNVEEGQIANSYDGQLFIWDRGTDEVDPITLIFDPAVQNAVWSRHDGRIYLTGTDRDLVELYRYDPADGSYSEFDTGVEAMESFTLAESASVALVRGTSVWTPQQLRRLDLEDGTLTPLHHPNETWFHALNPGTVKPFRFETTGGKAIDGRVYYPPNFDAAKKYPTIVYYYGGTVPVSRAFGGRYPKEWWASQGYLVFVPQPSGATGYGQSFSAEHVNNWGITTADQIIEGTQKFLAAHPSADPKRVGCIGASYGGFMTMLLTTKTDLFAAAVAHAGISSISSYWGEGNWGYSYSGAATAGSYPWNRSDIYVDQSPLFRADKHQVPLLLTHGRSDTNVPVGESDQFFIALRLLGKQVEYLQVEGEDHWILDHAKRTVWSRSIVAWFDRWLKEDDRWWNALYSERD
ncbi:MAG: S9 family peptidase, partial [Acidobacteriota bacterium]|nr:S9 family peptidase [Acidobacteriota bacterium]